MIVTDPTYAGIVNRIRLAGGVPRFVLSSPRRRAILIATGLPASSGRGPPAFSSWPLDAPWLPGRGDWLAALEHCRERDLFLIYDSAMERLLFDNRPLVHPLRMEGMAERTVVVGSLSRSTA